jgi:superfamily II DNA/RNA helicase
MQQKQRIKKLDGFRQGKCSVLICTDVASRGIDIPQVDIVINIHCPKDIDTLVHRCGRTARMGKEGKSIIIADGDDRSRLTKYKKDLGQDRIKNIQVPLKNLDPLRSDVEKLKILEKEEFKAGAQGRDNKWKQKISNEIEVELSEEEIEEGEKNKLKREEIQVKKDKVKSNLSKKGHQNYTVIKKNIFLSLDEMKKLSEQLSLARAEATEIRERSRTVDNEITKPLKYRVKPARDPSRRRKVRDNTTSFIQGPFGIAERSMNKRKPSIKDKSRSVKKYRKRR